MTTDNTPISDRTTTKTTAIHHGNQFKKILQYGSWYFMASILTKATGFLLLPIYTQYLTPADYGIQNSLTVITQLLPVFISLYLDAAFGRYYFLEKTVSKERVKTLYSTHFWFITVWGSAVVIIGFLIAPYTIQPLLGLSFLPYIPLTIVPTLFGQLGILGSIFFRSNLEAKKVSILNYAVFLANTGTVLLLLIPFNMGIQAKLYGAAVGSLISFTYFLIVSIKYSLLNFRFTWAILKRSLAFSIPLIPNIAGGWIAGLSDRLILAYYGELSQVGLYSVSAQIALAVYVVTDATTQVQNPIAMSALTEDNQAGKKQLSEFLSFFIWGILFFYLLITFFSQEILSLMSSKDFHSAYKLVGILAFGYVLSGIYRVFTSILSFHQKMWVISTAAVISAVLNLILNFVFIPAFGQVAAAWTTLVSILSYTIWITVWSQKYDPIDINYSLVVPSFLFAFTLLIIQHFIIQYNHLTFWQGVGVKSTLLFLYVGVVFILPGMNTIKLNLLKLQNQLIKKLRNP